MSQNRRRGPQRFWELGAGSESHSGDTPYTGSTRVLLQLTDPVTLSIATTISRTGISENEYANEITGFEDMSEVACPGTVSDSIGLIENHLSFGFTIMVKVGHANYSTTKWYLDMAGVVFRDEAAT